MRVVEVYMLRRSADNGIPVKINLLLFHGSTETFNRISVRVNQVPTCVLRIPLIVELLGKCLKHAATQVHLNVANLLFTRDL